MVRNPVSQINIGTGRVKAFFRLGGRVWYEVGVLGGLKLRRLEAAAP